LSFIITESVIAPYFSKCLENVSTYKQINHTDLSIGKRTELGKVAEHGLLR